MKIACLHPHFGQIGGGSKVFYQFINGLLARGHDISLYTIHINRQYYDFDKTRSIHINEYGGPLPTNPLYWMLLKQSCNALKKKIESEDFDIIFSDFFPDHYTAAIANTNAKKIYLCYEPYRYFYDKEFLMKAPLMIRLAFIPISLLYKRLDVEGVLKQDQVMGISKYILNEIKKSYNIDARLIYLGIVLDDFHPSKTNIFKDKHGIDDGNVLFTLGLSHHLKGMGELLEIFRTVLNKVPDTYLAIGGIMNPNNKKIFERMMRTLRIPDDRVILTGFIEEKELHMYYSASSVMLYTPKNEPYGLCPLEAMACGTPAIAFSGGPSETIDDGVTGYVIQDGNIEEYSHKVIQLLQDDDLRERMGTAGIERVKKNFDWELTVDKYERMMLDLIEK
ncbi:MAG: glycosyltransferase family 4 protein [Promethearchaeota archaeon]